MPFSPRFDEVYETIAAFEADPFGDYSVTVDRLDRRNVPGWINDDLEQALITADLCVADFTGSNPNVMWEAGYAMALGKTLIALTQDVTLLPFDVKPYRTIAYKRNNLGLLSAMLRQFLAETIPLVVAQAQTVAQDDASLLKYLLNTVATSDQRALIERFRTEGGLLARYFLSAHRDRYKEALDRAVHDKRVQLDSGARMAAAIEAIAEASKSVRAIAVLDTDRWSGKAYSHVIQKVAPKLKGRYHRAIVYPDRKGISEEQKETIHAEKQKGVEFRFGARSIVQRFYRETLKRDYIANLLIVDDEKMTHSLPGPSHDGELVFKKRTIQGEVRNFKLLWDEVLDPRPPHGLRI